ncbi:hypothetical protein A2U01_0074066, partial [Trifolium medium]|nr:hypothetical protein [Trifolium medium]
MQAMTNNPQPTENNGNVSWPPLGLPANYTPPEADNSSQPQSIPITIPVTNGGTGSQGVSAGLDVNASHATEDVQLGCPAPNQATA